MKPLRPFPFPLSIGTDICQISRIYAIVSSSRGERFINRILSAEEQSQNQARLRLKPNPSGTTPPTDQQIHHHEIARRDPEMWKTATFVAGRFAAKEAAIKAHSHRRLTFHDIAVLGRRRQARGADEPLLGSGPPVARIKGGEDAAQDTSAMVSISHDGDYATAVCMAFDEGVPDRERAHDWHG